MGSEERLARERSSPGVEHDDPRLGRVIADRYELVKRVGTGALGVVYEARQTALDRLVTLELLDAELVDREAIRERFKTVMQSLARVRHRGVMELEGFGVDTDGSLYVVTKRLVAPRLHEIIERERRLPWARARGLVLEIAAALDAAHRRSVTHGGLRPEACYVLTKPPGREQVVVTDFALAEVAAETRVAADAKGATTRIAGDPRYLPLEQFVTGRGSVPADVYALGAVLYHLLTGAPPYSGVNAFHALHQRRSRSVVPPRELEPSIPVEVEVVVMHALAMDPGNRYASARELAAALEVVPVDAATVAESPCSVPEPTPAPARAHGLEPLEPVVAPQPMFAPRPIAPSPVPMPPAVLDMESMVPTTHMTPFRMPPASAEDEATMMMARQAPPLQRPGVMEATTMLGLESASFGSRPEQTTVLDADDLRTVPSRSAVPMLPPAERFAGASELLPSETAFLPAPTFVAVPGAAPPSFPSLSPSLTPSAPPVQVPVHARPPTLPPLPPHSTPIVASPPWSGRTWLLVLVAVLVVAALGASIGIGLARTSTAGGAPGPEEPSPPATPTPRRQS